MIALVLGGASCVWDDVRRLEELIGEHRPGVTIAVNDIGSHWPHRLDHWCTVHPENFRIWKKDRADRGYNLDYVSWAQKLGKREVGVVDRVCPNRWAQGSSGYVAIGVAKEVGCSKVVLCGVPMTVTPHFAESTFHEPTQPWAGAKTHWKYWQEHAETMLGWVRSMSGNTRELLGAPDLEWLNEVQCAA